MSRRGLIIALIVSVALNLFVIGGVAGAALMEFRGQAGPPFGPPRRPMFAMADEMAADLTPEHREQWLTTLHEAAVGAGPRLRQSHELRRQAWGRLGADPADVQAVLAELTQARQLELQARGDIDRSVANFASGLPPEERRKLADRLSRARMGPRMMFSGRGPGGPGEPGPGPGPGQGPPLPDR
jgi:uncharacterized membrane protein